MAVPEDWRTEGFVKGLAPHTAVLCCTELTGTVRQISTVLTMISARIKTVLTGNSEADRDGDTNCIHHAGPLAWLQMQQQACKDWLSASRGSASKLAKVAAHKVVIFVKEDRLAGSDPTRTLLSMLLQHRQPLSHSSVSRHQLQGATSHADLVGCVAAQEWQHVAVSVQSSAGWQADVLCHTHKVVMEVQDEIL